MPLHVRRLKAGDTDRYGHKFKFEQLPHAAIDELPLQASGLLLYLLRTGPAFNGRIRDLYRVKSIGLGKDALEAAASALHSRGYLSYIDQRDARGRLRRVLVVTAVAGEFPDVSQSGAVSIRSHSLTSRNAESSQVGPRPEYQASVRPAETGIRAGGTEAGIPGLGATSRNGSFPQVGPRPEYQASVRPADIHDWSGIAPGQEGVPSRPRAGHTPTATHTDYSSPPVDLRSLGTSRGEDKINLDERELTAALQVLIRVPAPPGRRPLSYDEAVDLAPLVHRCLAEPGPWAPADLLIELSRDLADARQLHAVLLKRLTSQINPFRVSPEDLAWPHERGESPALVPIQLAPLQDCIGDCGRAVRSADGLCRDCRALVDAAPDLGPGEAS